MSRSIPYKKPKFKAFCYFTPNKHLGFNPLQGAKFLVGAKILPLVFWRVVAGKAKSVKNKNTARINRGFLDTHSKSNVGGTMPASR